MNSCKRCGKRFSHNYLTPISRTINEKTKKVLVCSSCKEILGRKEK